MASTKVLVFLLPLVGDDASFRVHLHLTWGVGDADPDGLDDPD